MTLPTIAVSTFEVTLPSNQKKLKLRSMLTKEEKVLLIAKESRDLNDVMVAVTDVIQACIQEPKDTKVTDWPIFDVEYAFVRLRSMSVSPTIDWGLVDQTNQKEHKFKIDLNDVKVVGLEGREAPFVINVGNGIKFTLDYPKVALHGDKKFLDLRGERSFNAMLAKSLVSISQNEITTKAKDIKPDELEAWVDTLPIQAYNDAREFFRDLPHIEWTTEYTDGNGEKVPVRLSTLNDFFMFV
jgi:hypothetical protein